MVISEECQGQIKYAMATCPLFCFVLEEKEIDKEIQFSQGLTGILCS